MKTYCKPKHISITDIKLIERAVYKAFDAKLRRKDFQKLLLSTGAITRAELDAELARGERNRINRALDALAEQLRESIEARSLHFAPLRPFQRRDGLTNKVRDLCKESPYQQVCEYIAVEALQPLFRAKLLHCQYGSIPGRGQVRGMRKIEKIVRRRKGKLTAAKCDVHKAYPSTKVCVVMTLLARDIGKNKPLLWFIETTMANYPNGALVIGGYLSTWLFNCVMSYVIRVMLAQGKYRRGKWIPYITAFVSYADDTAVFGSRTGVLRALRAASRWAACLGLTIKASWQLTRFGTVEDEKQNADERRNGSKHRTEGLDMMGFVVRRRCTIIRGRIWRRIRRQLRRAWRNLYTQGFIPWWRARRIASYKGWLLYSDSEKIKSKYHIAVIMQAAGEAVGAYERRRRYAGNLHTAA